MHERSDPLFGNFTYNAATIELSMCHTMDSVNELSACHFLVCIIVSRFPSVQELFWEIFKNLQKKKEKEEDDKKK